MFSSFFSSWLTGIDHDDEDKDGDKDEDDEDEDKDEENKDRDKDEPPFYDSEIHINLQSPFYMNTPWHLTTIWLDFALASH